MTESLGALLARSLAQLNLALAPATRERLLRFQDELLAWNKKYNLTAIRDPAESVEKNLVDSLTPLPFLSDRDRLLDLGSGAGLPAIPLKIARPALQVTSVEALEKKILFQRHVARRLNLSDFHPVRARIEELADRDEYAGRFTVVIARALAELEQLLAWAGPFLAREGRFIAMKGPGEQAPEVAAPAVAGWSLQEERTLRLPVSGGTRRLLIFRRESESG